MKIIVKKSVFEEIKNTSCMVWEFMVAILQVPDRKGQKVINESIQVLGLFLKIKKKKAVIPDFIRHLIIFYWFSLNYTIIQAWVQSVKIKLKKKRQN